MAGADSKVVVRVASEGIEEIRAANREAAAKWKRQKYSRTEGPLPTGPMSSRKD